MRRPERTARIFMGEMQRHRAVALTSSARYFAGFPTGYTALLGG